MRDGILIRVEHTVRPKEKLFEEMVRAKEASARTGNLRRLVCDWKPNPGVTTWIKMPTGAGSAFFDEHCIRAMRQAFCAEESDNI